MWPSWRSCNFCSAGGQAFHVMGYLVLLLAPAFMHAAQHFAETGQPVARQRREIRAAPERLASPASGTWSAASRPVCPRRASAFWYTMSTSGLSLAVDLDVDEILVHQRSRLGRFKAFMRHHMAPMAGGIADGQQYRLVLYLRHRKGFFSPTPSNARDCPCAGAGRGSSRLPENSSCRCPSFDLP